METAKNVYDVQRKQWRKWSNTARLTFNRLHGFMLQNQEVVKHPQSPMQPANFWNTTAHNVAWMAAEAVDGRGFDDQTKVVDV